MTNNDSYHCFVSKFNSFKANYSIKKKTFDATKQRKKEERDADGKLDADEVAQMLNDLPQEQDRIHSSIKSRNKFCITFNFECPRFIC